MVKYGTPPDWFTLISEGFGPPVQAGQLLAALDAVGLGDDAPLATATGIEGLLAVMKFPHIADKKHVSPERVEANSQRERIIGARRMDSKKNCMLVQDRHTAEGLGKVWPELGRCWPKIRGEVISVRSQGYRILIVI